MDVEPTRLGTEDTITVPYDEYLRLRKEQVLVFELLKDLAGDKDIKDSLITFINEVAALTSEK